MTVVKFVDDTTLIRFINNKDEESNKDDVIKLVSWCDNNSLILNTSKTIQNSIMSPLTPLKIIKNETIEKVESFKFLGATLALNVGWAEHVELAVIFFS